jgi:xanthine dehydrogenase accessory factor
MHEILATIEQLRSSDPAAAMATLIGIRGTRTRRPGAKLWITTAGRTLGSLTSGGCIEERVRDAAARVLAAGRAERLAIDLAEEDAWDLGLGCAASLDILVEPVKLDQPDDAVTTAYQAAARHAENGEAVAVLTRLNATRRRLVIAQSGARSGTLGSARLDDVAAAAALARLAAAAAPGEGAAELHGSAILGADPEHPTAELFCEVHPPPLMLVIFGAGPVAAPLVRIARELGMRTLLADTPTRAADPQRLPPADRIEIGEAATLAASLRYDAHTFVVLVSHDYRLDLAVLRHVLPSGAAYIGLLGGRRRGRALREFLAAEGMSAEEIARLRVPVGLDIGAESPAELALSILAEALAVRTARNAAPLSAPAS